MKTTTIYRKLFVATIAFGMIASGCNRKKDEISKDIETQSASDYAQAQHAADDAANIADAAYAGAQKFRLSSDNSDDNILSGCATVTRDTLNSNDPDTITIDFGSTACLCLDSRYRKGIITIIRFGKLTVAGSYRTVTFTNFYVGKATDKMHRVEGVHTITANGQNSSGHWNWTITAQNMKITGPNGKFHSWNSTRNREMIAGSDTPFKRTDDVFLITGNADGTNVNGNTYTATITSALRREGNCAWIVQGTVTIEPSGKPQRILDFGSGTCDNDATVTINGNVYNIELH